MEERERARIDGLRLSGPMGSDRPLVWFVAIGIVMIAAQSNAAPDNLILLSVVVVLLSAVGAMRPSDDTKRQMAIEAQPASLCAQGRLVQLQRQVAKLGVLANTDPLTGLLNRRGFMACCSTVSMPGTILFIDLNRFKRINDCYSHQTGDRVLKEIARRLDAVARGQSNAAGDLSVLCRWGGDEFVLFIPATGALAMDRSCSAIHEMFLEPVALDSGGSLIISAAVGSASIETCSDWEQAVALAGQHMLTVKQGDAVF